MTSGTLTLAAWHAPWEAAECCTGLIQNYRLARLRELGLIAEQQAGALLLHRLLAAFVRSEASDAETHRGQVQAAVQAEAQRVNEAGYPAPLLAWQPQLRFVADHAAEAGSEHAGGLFTSSAII
jgi:hypothetical protein